MQGDRFILIMTVTMSAITILIRALPFLVFTKKTPKPILYLGKYLPYAVMGMLVVYCLKGVSFGEGGTYGIAETIAIAVTVILHKWKHNTLLSIIAGTVLYMVLIQLVF